MDKDMERLVDICGQRIFRESKKLFLPSSWLLAYSTGISDILWDFGDEVHNSFNEKFRKRINKLLGFEMPKTRR